MILIVAIGLASVLLGYAYVYAFAAGKKMVFILHASGFLFFGTALFLRDFKSFLVFSLIAAVPLQLDYHLLYEPLKGIESTPFMAGITVDITDLILLVLYAHWLMVLSVTRGRHSLTIAGPFGTVLLLWITYVFVSGLLVSEHFQYTFYEFVALFKGFLIFFYLVNNATTHKDLRIIVYGLFAGTLAHAVYIILQYVTGLNYTLHGEFQAYVGPEGYRSIGFFGSPDAAASMMSLVLPVGLAYFVVVGTQFKRAWAMSAIFMVIIALLFTKVRAAWGAVLVSSVTLLLVGSLRGRISSRTLAKAATAAMIVVVLISPLVAKRFEVGTWGEDRAPLMLTAVNMFKDHWVFGVGANNYPLGIKQYVPPRMRTAWSYTVHNEYLLRLAETGLIGFILYYWLNLILALKLWKVTRSRDPWLFLVSAGLFAAMVGSVPHRIFSLYHYLNFFMQFCVILALGHLASSLDSSKQAGGASEQGEISGSNEGDPEAEQIRKPPQRI